MTLPLALPYIEKLRGGAERSLDTARAFSAGPLDYLSSFSHAHGFLGKSEEPLFPGCVALGLAAFSLSRRERPWVWIAVAATGLAVSFGPSLGVFTLLHELLPPYRALRVPSRAGILFLLGVAILAAVGASRLERAGSKAALLLVAAGECLAAPLPLAMDLPVIPPIYESVKDLPDDGGALVELPMAPPEHFQDNAVYVYRSALHRRPIVNGYSGFVPESYVEAFERVMRGPFGSALDELARHGVRYVLAHEGRLGPRMERGLDEALERGALRVVAVSGEDRLFEIVSPGPFG